MYASDLGSSQSKRAMAMYAFLSVDLSGLSVGMLCCEAKLTPAVENVDPGGAETSIKVNATAGFYERPTLARLHVSWLAFSDDDVTCLGNTYDSRYLSR